MDEDDLAAVDAAVSGDPEPLPPPPVEEPIPHMPEIQRPVPTRDRLVANRYEILEQIGKGGMGSVLKVRHTGLGKIFALKIIHAEMSENERARDMFYSEARLASSVEHANIVSITDFGEDIRRGAFIVMEYLKGESLADRLDREHRLPVPVACDIIAQTAEAMAFMHDSGVIHGDTKPENIFLVEGANEKDRRRNVVKVLDFGLSRLTRAKGKRRFSDHLAGTPAYLAPERACGSQPDELSDLYALGVLFYELLVGDVPFDGNPAQILHAHVAQPPTPPSWRAPEAGIDDRLDDLILTCLAKEPESRFSSVYTFLEELRDVMVAIGLTRRRVDSAVRPSLRQRSGDVACRAMVDTNPLPMFAVEADGRLSMVNNSFGMFVKRSPRELIGASLQETRLGTYCPGLLEDLAVVLTANKVTSRELEFAGPTGSSKVLIWLTPLYLGGRIVGAHGVVHWILK